MTTADARTTLTDLDAAIEAFAALGRYVATDSRDWGKAKGDAVVWAIVLGWGPDEDDPDSGDAMPEIADRYRWSPEWVATLRAHHEALRSLPELRTAVADLVQERDEARQVQAFAEQHAQVADARAATDRASAANLAARYQEQKAKYLRHMAEEHPILPPAASPAAAGQSTEPVRVVVVVDWVRNRVHSITASNEEAQQHVRELVAKYGDDRTVATMTADVVYPPAAETPAGARVCVSSHCQRDAHVWVNPADVNQPLNDDLGPVSVPQADEHFMAFDSGGRWVCDADRKPWPCPDAASGSPALADDGPDHCGLCGSESCPGGTGPDSCTPAHLMEPYEPASGDVTVMAADHLGPNDCRRCGGLDGTHTRRDCPHAKEATR